MTHLTDHEFSFKDNNMKTSGKTFLIIVVGVVIYLIALKRDIQRVDDFCAEMKPGLDVHKVSEIANKYAVGFHDVRDPGSVDRGQLGVKLKDKDNTWVFGVASLMTTGEHVCDVYHDNKVIISAKAG